MPAAPLSPDQAQAVEGNLMRVMDARLWNWAAWWRRDNGGEIRRATGQITRSPIAALMDHAPVRSVTGYSEPHAVQVDDLDAAAVHDLLLVLTGVQWREVNRYYVLRGGNGVPRQQSARRRALLALIAKANLPQKPKPVLL